MARMTISGALQTEGFLNFIGHYANRLSLNSGIVEASQARITLDLDGPAQLIDMLEMACWLGPEDCVVTDITLR